MPASSRGVPGGLALTLKRLDAPHALATPIAIAYWLSHIAAFLAERPPVSQGK